LAGNTAGILYTLPGLLKQADEEISKIQIREEVSDVKCDKCGANMVIKMGRYGKFLACPNFPECRNTKPLVEKIDVKCPKCKGDVVIRRTKKGKKFYGCENYPECDFVSWEVPSGKECPNCGSHMIVRLRKNGEEYTVCSDRKCGYMEEK